jgi:hypothetical protein
VTPLTQPASGGREHAESARNELSANIITLSAENVIVAGPASQAARFTRGAL